MATGKATRAQVYAAIDTERAYQDEKIAKDPTRHDPNLDDPHTVGNYLTMLRYYMTQADEAWTTKAGHGAALEVVRKIAAIGVHCMEDHGAPPRKP